MNWNLINMIVYIFSFTVGCITICLSVIYHIRKSYPWTRYYLIFQISLTIMLVLYALQLFANIFITDLSPILGTVVISFLYLDVAFMIYFIPYFTTWIIAHPWANPYRTIFLILSIVFLLLAGIETIFGPFALFRAILVVLFSGVFIFCIIVLLKNLKTIQDRDLRFISTSFIILSGLMMPFLFLDVFFTFQWLTTLPIYYFWVSLIILIYLIQYFINIPEGDVGDTDEGQLDHYRITDREKSVIHEIRLGFSSREIAEHLSISVNTVNNHIANIYSKTGVNSRIELLNLVKGHR